MSNLAKAGAQIFDLSTGPPRLDNLQRYIDGPSNDEHHLIKGRLNAYGASTRTNFAKPNQMRVGKAQAALKLHINDYNLPNQLLRKD